MGLDKLIIESLHIADRVRYIADKLLYSIIASVKNEPYTKSRIGEGPQKNGSFEYYDEYGISFNVEWNYFNFHNQEEIDNSKLDLENKFLPEEGTVHVAIVAINNRFNKKGLAEDIQHELSHMFEYYNKKRAGNTDMGGYVYDVAVDVLNNTDPETVENDIAIIFYIGNKSEQTGFANGAYQYLMQSRDYEKKFAESIEKTLLYRYYDDLKNAITRLIEYKGKENEIGDILEKYGMSLTRIINFALRVRRKLAWLIGRIMSKAMIDYRAKHGTLTNVPPSNKRKSIMETRRKQLKSIITKYYGDTSIIRN